MLRSIKLTLLTISGFAAFLAVIAVALIYFVDTDAYKPRLQTAATAALGMEVSIDGRLAIGFYPNLQLSMNDVHIRNQDKEIVAVERVRIGLELLSLLQDEAHITGISLLRPKITIEQGGDGKYNFARPQTVGATTSAVSLAEISVSGGVLHYTDKRAGDRVEAEDCRLKLRNLLLTGQATDLMQGLSFTAQLHCGRMRANGHTMSNLRLMADAKNGIFDLKPIRLEIFGGEGLGDIQMDLAGAIPQYHVGFSLPQFRIEELVDTRSAGRILEGPMAFSMNLSLQGKTAQQMKQNASGDVVLQGRGLKLHGHDLDLELDRYESSQNFNLMDMGAFFVAGPIGMAVTKGHDFANVLAGSGGVSDVRSLVSRWKVKSGVMYAQDVALATNRHRMALLGGLDMVHSRFVDVTLAIINRQGCAEVQQKISGPFEKPVVQQPNILKSVAGPVLKLFKEGRKLLPGGGCKVIYAGAVKAPR